MRAILQRVTEASVTVGGSTLGQIGPGLLVLICAMAGDTDATAQAMAAKIAKMRIFRDAAGKMNLSLKDTGGAALIVSQFTLAADLRGNRPGFSTAASPAEGERLYQRFIADMTGLGIPTASGRFGADMAVTLTNDGPVTIWVEVPPPAPLSG